jgi:hypothetical protein
MPRFTAAPDSVRPCAGTCGRLTRSSKKRISDYPGTISRYKYDMCNPCARQVDLINDARQEAARIKLLPPPPMEKRIPNPDAPAAHQVASYLSGRDARIRARVRRVTLGQSEVRI